MLTAWEAVGVPLIWQVLLSADTVRLNPLGKEGDEVQLVNDPPPVLAKLRLEIAVFSVYD